MNAGWTIPESGKQKDLFEHVTFPVLAMYQEATCLGRSFEILETRMNIKPCILILFNQIYDLCIYIYIHKIENPGNAKHCLKPVLLLRGLGSFPEFFSTIHEQNFVPLVMFWKKKTITIYRCVCIVEYIHHYIHLHVLGYVAYQLAKLCPSTVPP